MHEFAFILNYQISEALSRSQIQSTFCGLSVVTLCPSAAAPFATSLRVTTVTLLKQWREVDCTALSPPPIIKPHRSHHLRPPSAAPIHYQPLVATLPPPSIAYTSGHCCHPRWVLLPRQGSPSSPPQHQWTVKVCFCSTWNSDFFGGRLADLSFSSMLD
jgi:hypothetical protein